MADPDFDEFYRATVGRTLRYAHGVAGDLGTAQDLVQEAYVRAWQRWRTVSSYDHADAWLRTVITRLATDRWRRIALHRRYVTMTGPPGPAEPPGEDTVLLVRALRQLPVRQRQVLALHYLLDRTIEQIAEEVGAAEGTVKSWLSRGRSALARELEATGADEPVQPRDVRHAR